MVSFTKTDLLNFIAGIVQIAEQKIMPKLGPHEDFASCLFVADSDEALIRVAQIDIPAQYEDRVRMDAQIRQYLTEEQTVAAYAVTMMGWLREVKPGEDLASAGRVSEHPDRIETFMIMAGSRMNFMSKIYKVIRNKDQKISRLEDRSDERSEEHGLFVDMLGAGGKSNTIH